MGTVVHENLRLERCDGYRVESPHGEIGLVEEIWLDPDGEEARAIAVRTPEGRHGLILADEVAAVDAEQEWVVVGPEATLLELEPPRLAVDPGTKARRLLAVWETSGGALPEPPPRALPFPLRLLHPRIRSAEPRTDEEPVWRAALVLYALLGLVLAVFIGVVFLIPYVLTGHAY